MQSVQHRIFYRVLNNIFFTEMSSFAVRHGPASDTLCTVLFVGKVYVKYVVLRYVLHHAKEFRANGSVFAEMRQPNHKHYELWGSQL